MLVPTPAHRGQQGLQIRLTLAGMLEWGGPISGSAQDCREVTLPVSPGSSRADKSPAEGTRPGVQPNAPGTCFLLPGLATITPWVTGRFVPSSVLGTALPIMCPLH